ncbi:GFA family protein [Roseovarius aestuarii]
MTEIIASCGCRQAGTILSATPRVRFRCHCTKCQAVYRAPYADALVLRRGQARPANQGMIKWVRTKRPSPLVRGLCSKCNEPVLAYLYGVLTIIPTRTVSGLKKPPIDCDIYYRTRASNLDDEIPKHDGMLSSHIALALPLTRVLAMPGRKVS